MCQPEVYWLLKQKIPLFCGWQNLNIKDLFINSEDRPKAICLQWQFTTTSTKQFKCFCLEVRKIKEMKFLKTLSAIRQVTSGSVHTYSVTASVHTQIPSIQNQTGLLLRVFALKMLRFYVIYLRLKCHLV